MSRIFNTTGPCVVEHHYMLPPEQRLSQARQIVESGTFFVIHAPRQTGKTTLLQNLSHSLTSEERYAAITVSLEIFIEDDLDRTMVGLVDHLHYESRHQLPVELCPPANISGGKIAESRLRRFLSEWSAICPKPVVVFFDEIDAIPGQILLSVLRQLRIGYLSRARAQAFPHSVALVGLRDVRDYKIKVRQERDSLGTASPFNIKLESLTIRNFTDAEVRSLLLQHTMATGQQFTAEAQDEIILQSGGQPWLVNALAAQLVTRYDALMLDRSQAVTRESVLTARDILIERRDTHLDSLADRLREDRVRRVLTPILTGELVTDETYNDDFSYVSDLGLVKVIDGVRQIANPIYQEIISRVLIHQVQTAIADQPAWYVASDGTLDLDKLLDGFVEFWRENGEVLLRGLPYQEAAPHIAFMAFLQRIVNSGGKVAREFALGTRRADLVVDYGGRRDVIELKLAHHYKALERGLRQVAMYAQRLGRDRGYLVMFDTQTETPFEERGRKEAIVTDDVSVEVIWV